tara:strand:+ start:1760 stop:2197 length:438 start_codon:yes stop_codon:yes gene_type:complete
MDKEITYQTILDVVDDKSKLYEDKFKLDNKEDVISSINKYTSLRHGHELPIVWVKQSNPIITDFYPSEINKRWLSSFITYYDIISNMNNSDDNEIYVCCYYMFKVLTYVKGINIVDGVVYLLEDKYDFVKFKVDVMNFGVSPIKL